ncbi:hypothetical protein FHS56_001861 [Thermonema lapsum]|uniref:Uncharacterized protein n=1 Tax=Thermonema lapsum TaxID=28195 RepID=A0A846MRQ7_9BACT|nr:hypothetical protein [Thermonema lapsum]NIK74348.1 hypothetical protein [Thermonema lapsum]
MMKLLLFLCFSFIQLFSWTYSIRLAVDFEPVRGYVFVGPDTDLSMLFYTIKSQEEWETVFKPYPGHYPKKVTRVDFKRYDAIALIKNGYDYWFLRPQKVEVENGEVNFFYEAYITEKNIPWKAAIPLIVLIPKGQYKAVRFIENGRIVKRLEHY